MPLSPIISPPTNAVRGSAITFRYAVIAAWPGAVSAAY